MQQANWASAEGCPGVGGGGRGRGSDEEDGANIMNMADDQRDRDGADTEKGERQRSDGREKRKKMSKRWMESS